MVAISAASEFNAAFIAGRGKDAAIDILVEALTLKDRAVWARMAAHEVDPDGRVNLRQIEAEAAFYKKQGTLSGPIPNLDKAVDASFAEEAVKRLAPR